MYLIIKDSTQGTIYTNNIIYGKERKELLLEYDYALLAWSLHFADHTITKAVLQPQQHPDAFVSDGALCYQFF
jgi:hypothetical protein